MQAPNAQPATTLRQNPIDETEHCERSYIRNSNGGAKGQRWPEKLGYGVMFA